MNKFKKEERFFNPAAKILFFCQLIFSDKFYPSHVGYKGLGREDNEGIYSVVLHANTYKKQIEDEIKRRCLKKK